MAEVLIEKKLTKILHEISCISSETCLYSPKKGSNEHTQRFIINSQLAKPSVFVVSSLEKEESMTGVPTKKNRAASTTRQWRSLRE